MPTLLQINVLANQGSTGKIAEQLGEMVMNEGWRSVIAYGRGNPKSRSELIKIGNDFDIKLHALETRLFDNHGLSSRRSTIALIDKIKKIKPDIIHLHNLHGYYINYKILFKFLHDYNCPVVWTLHDCWTFTGHCSHFENIGCDKWKTGCYDCPSKRGYPNAYLFDRSKRNYSDKQKAFNSIIDNLHIVAVSDWLADLVRESFLSKAKVHVIKNGVDLGIFKPSGNFIKQKRERFRILGVSNIWSMNSKLGEVYKLRTMLPHNEYEIVLIGLTPEQVKKLPVGIKGITRTANQFELAKEYEDADVLINPTFGDTFPTINLESLACGTPVITYRTGGSPEAVDEKTGIVVERGNVQNMAEAIRHMYEHPLLAEDCYNRAHTLFEKDKCFAKYIDLYNELLK